MKLNPFAVLREEFDGSALVFNPDNNKIMTLNGSALIIWKALARGAEDSEIIKELQERFDGVAAGQMEADLQKFKSELEERGLLIP